MEDDKKELKTGEDAPLAEDKSPEEKKIDELISSVEVLLTENEKLGKDRDNYRDGLLAEKAKKAADGGEPKPEVTDDVRALVEAEVAKRFGDAEASKKKDAIISELKVALKNRNQFSGGAGTGGGDKAQPAAGTGLTDAQIMELKKRNPKFWTDEKIKELATRLVHK